MAHALTLRRDDRVDGLSYVMANTDSFRRELRKAKTNVAVPPFLVFLSLNGFRPEGAGTIFLLKFYHPKL